MYKLCKTEQSAQRQQEIEEGLLSMMLQKRYEDITVSDLCEKLELPRKSFYRYFGNKEDALLGLLDHRLMRYETHNSAVNLQKKGITLNLRWFFEFWLSQKDLLDALTFSNISGILVERTIQNCQKVDIFDYTSETYSKADMEMSTGFVVCGLMSIVLRWHHDGYQETPWEMAKAAHKILSRPFVTWLEI